MPNTTLTRGFAGTPGDPDKRGFAEKLALANNEDKQVNPVYVAAISKGLKRENAGMDVDTANYDKYTDGVFECWYYTDEGDKEPFLLQLECKRDVDLNDSTQFASVMLQVFYYIKQFERSGMPIPKVVVLGTQVNCLTIATSDFYDTYIKQRWYEPCQASEIATIEGYKPLLRKIRDDAELQTKYRVIEVTDKNAVSELCKDIVKTAKDIGIKEDIDVKTLVRAFEFFDLKVLSEKSRKQDTRVKVGAFMQLILNPSLVQADVRVDALGHRSYSDTLNFNGTVLTVDPNKFNSFANLFALKNRQLIEQKSLTAVQDMLIEDISRRRKGDYYTPSIWVDEAHKLMSKHLGDNWRRNSIVWDCAWGTGNLTRDYNDFGSLYCSTLYDEDIKTGCNYNPFATKFQYDFLNDDVQLFEVAADALWAPFMGTKFYKSDLIKDKVNFKDIADIYTQAVEANVTTEEKCQAALADAIGLLHKSKLHLSTFNTSGTGKSLVDELLANSTAGDASKPLVFFINPPYKTSGEIGDGSQSGVSDTMIKGAMKASGVSGSDQLWCQFFFRIDLIKRVFGVDTKIGAFTPTKILSLVKGKEINAGLVTKYGYYGGFAICAASFADVKPNWGISFTVWGSGIERKTTLSVLDLSDHDEVIAVREDKEMRVVLGADRGIEWAKQSEKAKDTVVRPRFTSAINYNPKSSYAIGTTALAVFCCDLGIVETNMQRVAILPSRINANWTFWDITKENFDRAVSFFTARKLIDPTWINCKDEYMVPNTEHPEYEQWQSDCIVYSLFNTASNQSSLRNIDYNGKSWNIFNEFFWLGRDQMYTLASTVANNEVMQDLLTYAKSGDRFVYKKLQTVHLSDDAKLVLDTATAILIDTMKYRDEFNKKHPEYHINTWDAGWYQIKAVAKEHIPDKLKLFNELYKKLEDRMRPLVYTLGFLYK